MLEHEFPQSLQRSDDLRHSPRRLDDGERKNPVEIENAANASEDHRCRC